jgi:hypothetical protein
MSTTDNDDEALSKGIEMPQSARRFHELYLADLGRVEPVSDAQILAAIGRVWEAPGRARPPPDRKGRPFPCSRRMPRELRPRS